MNPHSLKFSPLSPIHSPVVTPKRRVFGEIQNLTLRSPLIENIIKNSPLTSRSPIKTNVKRSTSKISRIFEERTKFKMSNKENVESYKFEIEESIYNQPCTSSKIDTEIETETEEFGLKDMEDSVVELHDSPVSRVLQKSKTVKDWNVAKMLPPSPERNFPIAKPDDYDIDQDLDDLESLTNMDDYDDNFDLCSKYEIVSTDSPDIVSNGRCSTKKINARSFSFGAPLRDSEPSTSFNKPNQATRMLDFSSFEFTSPQTKSVKKSLKFTNTPPKMTITPTKNDGLLRLGSNSSIGSMNSPLSTKLTLFPSETTTSMESGFISELDEPFLDLEDISNSPKMANFNDLLSGQIKETDFVLKRPSLTRSMSYNPETSKVRMTLFAKEEKVGQKRSEPIEEGVASASKKRRSNEVEMVKKMHRPVLQRAFSENSASIMSALARSASEPDLIGDFSQPFALPTTSGNHSDLKSISCDTLAKLLRGDYDDCVSDYKVIDCRYPYEFNGGHIKGALNMFTHEQIMEFASKTPENAGRNVLVFHCEYSLERGPKLSRYLRSTDRAKNKENYPYLNYPEIYLLHEGYRAFFNKYADQCSPSGYTMMLDPQYKSELVKFRRHNSSSKGFFK